MGFSNSPGVTDRDLTGPDVTDPDVAGGGPGDDATTSPAETVTGCSRLAPSVSKGSPMRQLMPARPPRKW